MKLSKSSIEKLQTCHKDIQKVILAVAADTEIQVIEGHRTLERQEMLFKQKKTKTMRSKHLSVPSMAVDVAPINNGKIDWNDSTKFYGLAKKILNKAKELNITLRFGGDWDMDGDFKDQTFNDLVHFEKV